MSFLKKVEALKVKLKHDSQNVGVITLKTTKGPITFKSWQDFAEHGAGLEIIGDLILTDTTITKLPSNLTVSRDLDVSGTKIEVLPTGLRVQGDLYCGGTPLTKIPADLHCEQGCFLERCNKLKAIPATIDALSLYLSWSTIPVPANLTLPRGMLDLFGYKGPPLPKGLTVSRLDLRRSNITSLPDDLTVGQILVDSKRKIKCSPALRKRLCVSY